MKKLFVLNLLLVSLLCQAQNNPSFGAKLARAGESIEDSSIVYDGSYRSIDYPGGDVPKTIGVCTDVIIRAYRVLEVDLQELVHKDILKNKSAYKNLKNVDTNIDHRRVPNMCKFFERHGKVLPITDDPKDYKPGDIIWWNLSEKGVVNHIGIVVNKISADQKRHLIIHNIGFGQNVDDFLFGAKIVGHYSYASITKKGG